MSKPKEQTGTRPAAPTGERRGLPPTRWVPWLLLLLLLMVGHLFLRYPTTASAPPGLYLLTYRPLTRDAWVVACLPPQAGRFGRHRGYLSPGRCPGRASEVLKRVAALPGDQVHVDPAGLTVNGRPLPGTARLSLDRRGRPVPAVEAGPRTVPPGTVWLYSAHSPRSWDSRYYGGVPLAGVRSTARLLLPSPWYSKPPPRRRAPLR